MSSDSPAASKEGVAPKKAARRRARGMKQAPVKSWHPLVDDILTHSSSVSKVQVVNGEASAFVSLAIPQVLRTLAKRADIYRRHAKRDKAKAADFANAARSQMLRCSAEVQADLEEILAEAAAAQKAFIDSKKGE